MAFLDFAGELSAIAGAICFGVSNVIIRSQSEKIKPMAINAIRISISAIIYTVILLSTGLLLQSFSIHWSTALLLSFGSLIGVVIGDIIFFFSQQLIGLSRAYPIAVSYPLFTYIIGMIIGTEFFNWFRMMGVILVILGVYLISISTRKKGKAISFFSKKRSPDENTQSNHKIMNGEDETHSADDDLKDAVIDPEKNDHDKLAKRKIIFGIVGAIITTICWTAGTLLLKSAFTTNLNGIAANGYRMITIAPISMVIFAAGNRGKYKSTFSKKGLILIIIAGLIGNTLGGLLYVFALQYSEASITAAITAAAPLVATPLSVLFLKEKVSWILIVGTILTLGGIWLIILF